MAGGIHGLIYTSTLVIAETATLILARTNNSNRVIEKFHEMLKGTTLFIRVLDASSNVLEDIWNLFNNHNKKVKTKKEYLSFVDASNVFLYRCNEIETIVSFDVDFDLYMQRAR